MIEQMHSVSQTQLLATGGNMQEHGAQKIFVYSTSNSFGFTRHSSIYILSKFTAKLFLETR